VVKGGLVTCYVLRCWVLRAWCGGPRAECRVLGATCCVLRAGCHVLGATCCAEHNWVRGRIDSEAFQDQLAGGVTRICSDGTSTSHEPVARARGTLHRARGTEHVALSTWHW